MRSSNFLYFGTISSSLSIYLYTTCWRRSNVWRSPVVFAPHHHTFHLQGEHFSGLPPVAHHPVSSSLYCSPQNFSFFRHFQHTFICHLINPLTPPTTFSVIPHFICFEHSSVIFLAARVLLSNGSQISLLHLYSCSTTAGISVDLV